MKLSIMSPTDSEQEGLAPTIAVCAAAGIFGLWTAFSSPQWFDSAEFGAVGSTLSVSHAPGHPLHALMVKGAQLLPFGDVAFRSNASSAIALAIALGCFYRLLRRLVPEAPVLVAACVALTPALMPAIWLQGARGEVYALQFCISVLIADYCFRLVSSRDPRHLLLVAFLMGLGGALHSLITALMAPIVIWAMLVALPRNAKGLRTIAWSVLACFAGLATNAYLIIRASAGGDVGWGKPDNLSALWDTLTGREWYAGYESPPVDVHENIISIMSYCIEQLGAPAALLLFLVAVAGIGALLRARDSRALAALVVVVAGFGSRVIYPLDLLNPDLGGYVMAGLTALLVLPLIASVRLSDMWPGRLSYAPWVFVVVFALAALRFDAGGHRDDQVAESMARGMLAEVPTSGTLVTSSYTTGFHLWYLRAAEGFRPDVPVVFRPQVDTSWFRERLASVHPEAARRLSTFPQGYTRPGDRFEAGVEADRLGPMNGHLRQTGLLLSTTDAPFPSVQEIEALYGRNFAVDGIKGADNIVDTDSRRNIAFHHFLHAEHLLDFAIDDPRARALAAWHTTRCDKLLPDDPQVQELRLRLAHAEMP